MLRRKFIPLNVYIRKGKEESFKSISFHNKKPDEQDKHKASSRKVIIKSRNQWISMELKTEN